ncbi:peptide chain release factor N(5)-glutamine methyltransferase [Alphaproteobacteria bacterium]|nr:peptide chain release factor N(5)-glutamine methyltransferase [Alphaproteobacteria bacterium]MDA8643013.1 peptide chain release factor N(5)-glutamine methyltransferase [Alphaproteobacteria bacterium]MDA8666602.1 peptide chain release factor N(5)-glutamine methyltransferase [Alphaproteobacteria bacterium]MDB2406840.1 peptide chain release factor N(5)-glutamine methyltransferase [Alphaproteobacteria bacterium]MDB2477002.1 peptide chain release factor N(5)-glutamine methyltransferase [Alphaprot
MRAEQTLEALQRRMMQQLKTQHHDTVSLDARLLLEHASGLSSTDLAIQAKQEADATLIDDAQALVALRLTGMPVAKIIGHKEFWGRRFHVSPAVLDPRPDSETLIEAALALLPEGKALRLIDLGTGSGCLLLTLLAERPFARGLGIDKSRAALSLARRNAHCLKSGLDSGLDLNLGLRRRVVLRHGDWLHGVNATADMIIANPPYIESGAIDRLDRDVRLFDPRLALDGGSDGIGPYHALIAPSFQCLTGGGHLLLEIGVTQAEAISALMAAAGFADISLRQDLAGRDRVLIGRKP